MTTKPAVMVFRKGGSGAKEAPAATTGKAAASTKPDTSLSTKNFVVPRLKMGAPKAAKAEPTGAAAPEEPPAPPPAPVASTSPELAKKTTKPKAAAKAKPVAPAATVPEPETEPVLEMDVTPEKKPAPVASTSPEPAKRTTKPKAAAKAKPASPKPVAPAATVPEPETEPVPEMDVTPEKKPARASRRKPLAASETALPSVAAAAAPLTVAAATANDDDDEGSNPAWLAGGGASALPSRKTTGSRRKSMPIGFRTGASSDVTAKPLPPQPAALSKRAASAAAASAAAAAADTKLAAVQREMADACNMLDSISLANIAESPAVPEKPLLDKLRESWSGKSYYERLSEMADEPKQPQATNSPAKAGKASKGKGKASATSSSTAAVAGPSKPPVAGAAAASLEVESLRGELAARDEALATMTQELNALRDSQAAAPSPPAVDMPAVVRDLAKAKAQLEADGRAHSKATERLRAELDSLREQLRQEKERSSRLCEVNMAMEGQLQAAVKNYADTWRAADRTARR